MSCETLTEMQKKKMFKMQAIRTKKEQNLIRYICDKLIYQLHSVSQWLILKQ